MKKYRGFTLLEMILSISIILIILSVSNINFNVRDRLEAKYQLRELSTNIKFIKNYAQINNCRTNIIINDDGYEMYYGNHKKSIKFNKLIKVIDSNTRDIRFTLTGKPSNLNSINSAGTIKFSIDDKPITLTIQPVTGKVNLYEKEK